MYRLLEKIRPAQRKADTGKSNANEAAQKKGFNRPVICSRNGRDTLRPQALGRPVASAGQQKRHSG